MDILFVPRIYALTGFARENILGGARALDIGCGGRKLPGAVGFDVLSLQGVDIVHDINHRPWPIKNNEFDLVFLNHALEHVEDIVGTMEEIHRILAPGGRVVVQVPYFRAADAYADPTHKHFFTSQTLDYFIEGTAPAGYEYTDIRFTKKGFWYGWPHSSNNPLKQMIKSFVHKHPRLYDQRLSVFFPVKCLTWELETIK